jgi:hypothetical protein
MRREMDRLRRARKDKPGGLRPKRSARKGEIRPRREGY